MMTALIAVPVGLAWLFMTIFSLGMMDFSVDEDGPGPILLVLLLAPMFFFGAIFILFMKATGPFLWKLFVKKIFDLGRSCWKRIE